MSLKVLGYPEPLTGSYKSMFQKLPDIREGRVRGSSGAASRATSQLPLNRIGGCPVRGGTVEEAVLSQVTSR